ncbi:MAG: NYN domain-containing protein [Chloroflexota bacterium]|nr:NYN domain-containing protein [Chloroflexota bacterium]MDE2841385.1 NYN domain-containing protein [Chloroflexota bacterium]MDE2932159.1 NYN domain-containing protein [Chloroflexota bacterium]
MVSGLVKTAVLIDGGFFLKRLPQVRHDIDTSDPDAVAKAAEQLVQSHLEKLSSVYGSQNPRQLLYRIFYYDALPFGDKAHRPVSKRSVDYAKSDVAMFRRKLFEVLRTRPNVALRLGQVRKPREGLWVLKQDSQKRLLSGDLAASDLEDSDFTDQVRQKGVDMRIGLDIATITLKKQANIIVLVAGDSDFVPAAKLARREGVIFILDPLWQQVAADLSEHIDKLTSGISRPQQDARTVDSVE